MQFEEMESQFLKIQEQFELFKSIARDSQAATAKVDLKKLKKIIEEQLPVALAKNAPPNFPGLYFDFKYEYEKFREYILFEHLIGRNIVAPGGGFSSGKSSFLNSLMGKPILPADIDPSTSVPAYIVHDKDTAVYGVNIFDSKIAMNVRDIKIIAHGFGELSDENNAIVSDEVTLGHILRSLFLATPLQTYEHIAFLDTPGYSKPDTAAYSAKTDEKVARAELNSSNYILWFVQADGGTITEEDINFLNSLKKEIPKLIIVNKADKCTPEDIRKIVAKIRGVLDIKGIQYVDVLAFSRNKPDEFDGARIKEYIKGWDKAVYESTFAHNFKVLFVKCKEYYESVINEESRRLNRLQKALTLSDDETVTECLNSLVAEIKRNIAELKDIGKTLKELQDEFFTAIKFTAVLVGIEMPEPTEIDLIKDKVKDPLQVLEDYKKKQGAREKGPDLTMALRDAFSGINPVINRTVGGSDYKDEVSELIKANLVIDKSKIKFGK